MKLNGVEQIPSSLVACMVNGEEVPIEQLAYEGFSFRVPEPMEQLKNIELKFYQYNSNQYQSVTLLDYQSSVEEKKFFYQYVILTHQIDYLKAAQEIISDYSNYVGLKLDGDDEELSAKMTGLPLGGWEDFYETFEEQKMDWLSPMPKDTYQLCTPYELALTIDSPEKYQDYLNMEIEEFQKKWLEKNYLGDHPLFQTTASRLYVGNQFCHNLFPEKSCFLRILKKAQEENLQVTVATTYMREECLEETERLWEDIYQWCQENEMALEVVVNDWGMVKRLETWSDLFTLSLGVLLNKRRKDPRMEYKNGFLEKQDLMLENGFSHWSYQEYLKKRWNICRYEVETCGYVYEIPRGRSSLHVPYYQTNTSQYCTLYAKLMHGERGNQRLIKNCANYCSQWVFLYPKSFNMVGINNSLFGFDNKILTDEKYLHGWIEQGVDRIVLDLL